MGFRWTIYETREKKKKKKKYIHYIANILVYTGRRHFDVFWCFTVYIL